MDAILIVLTVNSNGLTGNPRSASTDPTSKIRHALLKDSIHKSDIVLLQEIKIKNLINEDHGDTHHIYFVNGDTEAGILLKRERFEDPVPLSASNYQSDIDRLNSTYSDNEQLELGRFYMCLATVAHTKIKVLFVSYHGVHNGVTSLQQLTILSTLLQLLRIVQDERSASHIVLGGDFNLAIGKVDISSIPKFQPPERYVPTRRRSNKSLIDYFILSKGIECISIEALPFNDVLIERYLLENDDILDHYLDHDPVRLLISLPIGSVGLSFQIREVKSLLLNTNTKLEEMSITLKKTRDELTAAQAENKSMRKEIDKLNATVSKLSGQ